MPHKTFLLILPLLVSILLMAGFVVGTGHLTDGPQMIDDNQIYKLQIDFEEKGFWPVLGAELQDRILMRRLFPMFLVQKVVQARLFGGNMIIWSLWMAALGGCVTGLLFSFFRQCHGTLLASIAFALLVVVGEQTVVWWRLVNGEGIGMFWLSLGLVLMAQNVKTGKRRFEIAFLVALTLATLSKESFILVTPAILFLKTWLTVRERDVTIWQGIRQNWLSIGWLAAVMMTELMIIKFGFATTSFVYTGWMGFNRYQFDRMVNQFAGITNAWLLVILLIIPWVFWTFRPARHSGGRPVRHGKRTDDKRAGLPWTRSPWASVLMAAVFCLLMTLPQLLLYMSSGMLNENDGHYGRYILPAIVGYAFLIAEITRLVQQAHPGNRFVTVLLALAITGSLIDKGWTATSEARAFAVYSRQTDEWFEQVVANSEPDDPIVLVFRGNTLRAYSIQVALRTYYLLAKRYNRPNVYFCLIPPDPSIAESIAELEQEDTKRHALNMRTVDQLEGPPRVVMVLNWGTDTSYYVPTVALLEFWLWQQERRWFDPGKYRRVIHPHQHITYFLKE